MSVFTRPTQIPYGNVTVDNFIFTSNTIDLVGYVRNGDPISNLTNNIGYITSAALPNLTPYVQFANISNLASQVSILASNVSNIYSSLSNVQSQVNIILSNLSNLSVNANLSNMVGNLQSQVSIIYGQIATLSNLSNISVNANLYGVVFYSNLANIDVFSFANTGGLANVVVSGNLVSNALFQATVANLVSNNYLHSLNIVYQDQDIFAANVVGTRMFATDFVANDTVYVANEIHVGNLIIRETQVGGKSGMSIFSDVLGGLDLAMSAGGLALGAAGALTNLFSSGTDGAIKLADDVATPLEQSVQDKVNNELANVGSTTVSVDYSNVRRHPIGLNISSTSLIDASVHHHLHMQGKIVKDTTNISVDTNNSVLLNGSSYDNVVLDVGTGTLYVNDTYSGNVHTSDLFAQSGTAIYSQSDLNCQGNLSAQGEISTSSYIYSTNQLIGNVLQTNYIQNNYVPLKIISDTEFLGNVRCDQNEAIYNNLTANALYVSYDASVFGNVWAEQDLYVIGNIYQNGYKFLTSNVRGLNVLANLTLSNDLIIANSNLRNYIQTVSPTPNLQVITSNVTVTGNLTTYGNLYVPNGFILVDKIITNEQELLIDANVRFTDGHTLILDPTELIAEANIYCWNGTYSNTLTIGNSTLLNGNTTITGNLVVSGNSQIFIGNANIFSYIQTVSPQPNLNFIQGNTTIWGNLQVSNGEIYIGNIGNLQTYIQTVSPQPNLSVFNGNIQVVGNLQVSNGQLFLGNANLYTYIQTVAPTPNLFPSNFVSNNTSYNAVLGNVSASTLNLYSDINLTSVNGNALLFKSPSGIGVFNFLIGSLSCMFLSNAAFIVNRPISLTNSSSFTGNISELTNDSGFITSVPSSYVSNNSSYNAKLGDITATSLSLPSSANFTGYYSQLAGKPTALSSFTNDSGYITSSSLSGYLTSSAASSTYLTISNFNSTSLTSNTYLQANYTTLTDPRLVGACSNTFATATYLPLSRSVASNVYLQATYLANSTSTNAVLNNLNASGAVLSTGGFLTSWNSTALAYQLYSGVGLSSVNGNSLINNVPSSGVFTWNVNGTQYASLNSGSFSHTGNIYAASMGVGTSSPGYTLDVNGTGRFGLSTAQVRLGCATSSSISGMSSGMSGIWIDTISNRGIIQSEQWGVSWSPTVINPNGGLVGIGMLTPLRQLDITGNVRINDTRASYPHYDTLQLMSPNSVVYQDTTISFGQSLTTGNCGVLQYIQQATPGTSNLPNSLQMQMYNGNNYLQMGTDYTIHNGQQQFLNYKSSTFGVHKYFVAPDITQNPVYTFMCYDRSKIYHTYDCYYDGTNWKSSMGSANGNTCIMATKSNTSFAFYSATASSLGSTITFGSALLSVNATNVSFSASPTVSSVSATSLTLLNGCFAVNRGSAGQSGLMTPGYYLEGSRVWLYGGIAGAGQSTVVATLPVGYRPLQTVVFSTGSGIYADQSTTNTGCYIYIFTNGNITTCQNYTNGVIYLDGLSFRCV